MGNIGLSDQIIDFIDEIPGLGHYGAMLALGPDPSLDARDPRRTSQRAVGNLEYLKRHVACGAYGELFPSPNKWRKLEDKGRPVPFGHNS